MKKSSQQMTLRQALPIVALAVALTSRADAQALAAERISPEGQNSYAFDVNDAGMVVGFIADDQHVLTAAAWNSSNVPIALENPGFESMANAVNNDGVAVGYVRDLTFDMRPYKWVNGQAILLDDLGNGGRAIDINNSGEITGFVINPAGDSYWACKWSASGDLEILEVNGEPSPFSSGTAINDLGAVAGTATFTTSSSGIGIWADGQFTQLGTNDVYVPTPYAITNDGQVYGFGININGQGTGVVRWNVNGISTFLPPFGSAFTAQLYNANEQGVGVGWSGTLVDPHRLETRATAWVNDVPRLLQQPEGSSVTLYGVNESGLAVGVVKTDSGFYAAKWDIVNSSAPIGIDPIAPAEPGETITISATVMNSTPIAGRTVTFRFGNTTIGTRTSDAQGRASMAYTIPSRTAAGRVDVMASLGGSKYQITSLQINRAATRLAAQAGTWVSSTRKTFQAQLRHNRTNSPMPNQVLRFTFGNRSFSIVTNRSGQARVTVPVSVLNTVANGQYTVTYSGNSGHSGASATSGL